MSIYWATEHKRWRFEFDSYVQGRRHRATKLLPKGWSKAKAEAFDRLEGARLSEVATGISDADPLIETAVTLYLGDKPGLKSYHTAAEHLAAILPAYEGKRMSALADIAREVNDKRGRNDGKGALADATVHQRLALLRAACRWAWRKHKLTKHDPTTGMQLPTVRNERHNYLSRRQMLQTCRRCTSWQAQIALRVAFYTGMRLGELLRAEPGDGVLILADTKNGDRRAIPVHPKISHLVRFMPLPGPKITIQRAVSRAMKRVKVSATFHDLRHSAASEMVNAGVELSTVGVILGHRDPRSTLRYAHHNTALLTDAIRVIGRK